MAIALTLLLTATQLVPGFHPAVWLGSIAARAGAAAAPLLLARASAKVSVAVPAAPPVAAPVAPPRHP